MRVPENLESFTDRMEYRDGTIYWKEGPLKGKECGWVDRHGYRCTRMGKHLVRNHHIVWYLHSRKWPESSIDHINNDPSDNHIENLRLATQKQNSRNQKLQKRRQGEFKGVYRYSDNSKWYVKVKHNRKNVGGLGSYSSKLEAGMIYNITVERLFGEFANYNAVFLDVEKETLDKEL